MKTAFYVLLEIVALALLAGYGGVWGFAFWLALTCGVVLTQRYLAIRAVEAEARIKRRRKRVLRDD